MHKIAINVYIHNTCQIVKHLETSFIIFSQELGKNWEAIQSEDDTAIDNDAESEKE